MYASGTDSTGVVCANGKVHCGGCLGCSALLASGMFATTVGGKGTAVFGTACEFAADFIETNNGIIRMSPITTKASNTFLNLRFCLILLSYFILIGSSEGCD